MTDNKRDPEKQRGYVREHMKKLDEIKVRPVKGTKARWAAAADAAGVSLQRFIIDAVEAVLAATDKDKPEG